MNTMNKIITAAGILFVCCFSSCASKQPDHDSTLGGTEPEKTTVPAAATNIPQNSMPTAPAQLPVSGQPLVNPLPQQMVNQAIASPAPGMNPAHGQPNHRCDIAVGAPLNSAPTKPATQTVQTVTPTQSPVTGTTAKTVTAPGMNPPHGEPNHRCDIAVGAPLNSPATKPATQTITPVVVPAKKDSGS